MSNTYSKEVLAADPDPIVFGEASEGSVEPALESGVVHLETIYTLTAYRMIQLEKIRSTSPAEYHICKDIVRRDPTAQLPRGIARKLRRPIDNVTYEEPIEFIF